MKAGGYLTSGGHRVSEIVLAQPFSSIGRVAMLSHNFTCNFSILNRFARVSYLLVKASAVIAAAIGVPNAEHPEQEDNATCCDIDHWV